MPIVHYGSKDEPAEELKPSKDLIAVRTRSGRSAAQAVGPVATPASSHLDDGTLVARFPEAQVEVWRVPVGKAARALDERKRALRSAPDVRFAGGVLVDPQTGEPVLYTENLFVKFVDTADPDDCEVALREAGLAVKREVDYATNAYFVEAPEGTGQRVFDIAQQLLARHDVEYCHPELIRPRARKAIAPPQWHLMKTTLGGVVIDAHANVAAAQAVTRGEGITIAVIDDGIDIDHPDFGGAGKVVAPRDATLQTDDPRPKDPFGTGTDGENHGTACAGVACANGTGGASGVAPGARLMPIRLSSGLGSQREAEAFKWAADHGADVISCSWGPPDGRWWDASDPRHQQRVPLPASTRLVLDHVTSRGRDGKGCVVLFAAGNGNESVDLDGYASFPKVIAVAACNDRGTRSVYSDFGDAVSCAFPSSDFGHAPFDHPPPLTPGIWTTDRRGRDGYNPGRTADGDAAGHYTNSFGGTSSACPGAAGVAALVLSVNPALKWDEVKHLMERACDRIDPSGGAYDARGHSKRYGHGRLNALTALQLARPQPRNELVVQRRFDAPLPDLQVSSFVLEVSDAAAVASMTVSLDLAHTWIGDLVITLMPPPGSGLNELLLHNRQGGAGKSIRQAYDASTTPGLAFVAGRSCAGPWTLRVHDTAAQDSGTLVSFGLSFTYPPPAPVPVPAPVSAPEPAPTAAGAKAAARPRPKKRKAPRREAAEA